MLISIYLVLFFISIIIGDRVVNYLGREKLCPCMIKVPFTLLVLLALIFMFITFGTHVIIIPLMSVLLVGSFLVGQISIKFPVLKNVGAGVFIAGYLYTIVVMFLEYGFPLWIPSVIVGVLFLGYVLGTFFKFKLNIQEIWHEYIYTMILFLMFLMTIPSMFFSIGIGLFLCSELSNQVSRVIEGKHNKVIEYLSAKIYIIAIVFMILPIL